MINQIWPIYDVDQSGNLDQDETRRFVRQYMEASGFDEAEFKEDIFIEMFNEFDEDGSGLIEKDEMYDFIAKISGKSQKKKKLRKNSRSNSKPKGRSSQLSHQSQAISTPSPQKSILKKKI